jgi:putative ATP-binding cassette transporter
MAAILEKQPIAAGAQVPAGTGDPPAGDALAQNRLIPQLRLILQPLRGARVRKTLIVLSWTIAVVIALTAYGQILLNRWNKPFFDALSRRDMQDFLFQLGVFFLIGMFLLTLNVAQRWLVEMLKLKLREGLVGDLLATWLQPRRAFHLANSGQIGVNPDQRLHEDARKLCELSCDLAAGLLQSSILFLTFAGVLWVLSRDFSIRILGQDWVIPGFMLWAAIAYAGAGSLLSYWVGGSLIERNAERYGAEAELRASLVRINDRVDGIALAAGESNELKRVDLDLAAVLKAIRRLVTGLTNLTWVTAGFGWFTTVAPILVAVPLYFDGRISFGGLMMAAAAFTQTQSSLRWFVDNFSVIADWRATLLRVASFRLALRFDVETREYDTRIRFEDGEPGQISIDGLEVFSAGGRDAMKETQVTVTQGERVLIIGAPGTRKTLLFRALAGLWPWGKGQVTLPAGEAVHYLPRGAPYLPRGTVRELLAYPQSAETFQTDGYRRALERLGLQRLVPLLDADRRWESELALDEQIELALARVVLHAPPWLLVDDTFSGLEDDALERVQDVFRNELRGTGLLYIGHAAQSHDPLFSRVLHLVHADSSDARASRAVQS